MTDRGDDPRSPSRMGGAAGVYGFLDGNRVVLSIFLVLGGRILGGLGLIFGGIVVR